MYGILVLSMKGGLDTTTFYRCSAPTDTYSSFSQLRRSTTIETCDDDTD